MYFKHGRDWCYIGPLEKVNLADLISELDTSPYHDITTKLGSSVLDLVNRLREKSLKYVLIRILAITLLVIGVLGSFYAIYLLLTMSVSASVAVTTESRISGINVGNVYMLRPKVNTTVVSIKCYDCSFRVGNESALIKEPPPRCMNTLICGINGSYIDMSRLSKDMSEGTIKVRKLLLIFISRVLSSNAKIVIKFAHIIEREEIIKTLIRGLIGIMPLAVMSSLLIWAGIELTKWLKRSE